MKIAIDVGHNCPPDTGCLGLYSEDLLTHSVGIRVMKLLSSLGHSVVNCLPDTAESVVESLLARVDIANEANADYYVAIHFNCFDGSAHGVEVLAESSVGRSLAHCILDQVSTLGFKNRGVQEGSHLYVIRNTEMPAVLVECCFCDNAHDMKLFNADKMAEAIATGIQNFLDAVNTAPSIRID